MNFQPYVWAALLAKDWDISGLSIIRHDIRDEGMNAKITALVWDDNANCGYLVSIRFGTCSAHHMGNMSEDRARTIYANWVETLGITG